MEPMAFPDSSDHGEFRVRIEPYDGAFRRGVNDFAVHATDASGTPVTLTSVRARMPLHNHVTDAPAIAPDGSQWVVSNLILWMPGRWEITLRMTRGSVYDDTTILIEVP